MKLNLNFIVHNFITKKKSWSPIELKESLEYEIEDKPEIKVPTPIAQTNSMMNNFNDLENVKDENPVTGVTKITNETEFAFASNVIKLKPDLIKLDDE